MRSVSRWFLSFVIWLTIQLRFRNSIHLRVNRSTSKMSTWRLSVRAQKVHCSLWSRRTWDRIVQRITTVFVISTLCWRTISKRIRTFTISFSTTHDPTTQFVTRSCLTWSNTPKAIKRLSWQPLSVCESKWCSTWSCVKTFKRSSTLHTMRLMNTLGSLNTLSDREVRSKWQLTFNVVMMRFARRTSSVIESQRTWVFRTLTTLNAKMKLSKFKSSTIVLWSSKSSSRSLRTSDKEHSLMYSI